MVLNRLKRKVIQFIIALTVIFLVLFISLYISMQKEMSIKKIDQSSKELTTQICSTFELMVDQIINQTSKYLLSDNDISVLVENRFTDRLNSRDLYKALKSIYINNDYIYSIDLYIKNENVILDSSRGYSLSIDAYEDQQVADNLNNLVFLRVDPHIIVNPYKYNTKTVVYSLLFPLSEGNKLIINIDFNKLYCDILKRNNQSSDLELYICDKDNKILVANDLNYLGEYYKTDEKTLQSENGPELFGFKKRYSGIIESKIQSKELGWNFIVNYPYNVDFNSVYQVFYFIRNIVLVVIILFLLSLIFYYIISKPINVIENDYLNKQIKELILDINTEKNNIEAIGKYFLYNNFSIMLIEPVKKQTNLDISKIGENILKDISSKYNFNICTIPISACQIAVICNYKNGCAISNELNNWINEFYNLVKSNYTTDVFITLSKANYSLNNINCAYYECKEIQECKLSFNKNIILLENCTRHKDILNYPKEIEKQLINNIIIGDLDCSKIYLNKFLSYIFDNDIILSDYLIKNYIYQLQNEILKHISCLPISINLTANIDAINNSCSQDEISRAFNEEISFICDELYKKKSVNENNIQKAILDYIDQQFKDPEFNLNALSYQFNINRNHIAAIIKEATSHTFNDYINIKKIEYSKQLLLDEKLTIDNIAVQSGFNYTHYFIKIFKKLEGITPGQYRSLNCHQV